MKKRLVEHGLSILLVVLLFALALIFFGGNSRREMPAPQPLIAPFAELDFLDFGNPLHRALFKEALDDFYPDSLSRNDSVLKGIDDFRQEQFTNPALKAGGEKQGLSATMLTRLGGMYVSFVCVYILVLVSTYYGAQTLAVIRFVAMKQGMSSYLTLLAECVSRIRSGDTGNHLLRHVLEGLSLLLRAALKGIAYTVLFSPAYVIAYSLKTSVDTDSYIFMIVLGVVSNGLLINYANRFYTFLLHESRKGYVETAIVKNLHNSYAWNVREGISFRSVFRLQKAFPSHVFQHIFLHARFQAIPSLKEHASFLVTGLVIIEMALNIQGHLCYELMQYLLYRQYDVVITILLGIFFVVKATEVVVDAWFARETMNYEN